MKNKPVIYETAKSQDAEYLDQVITDMMDDGWELYGSPYTAMRIYDGVHTTIHCQAMVMDEQAFQKHFVDGK
jgi:hypothetical protein